MHLLFYWEHIFFVDKLSTELQLPLHLSKLITSGQHSSSIGFKSTKIILDFHCLLFYDIQLVAKELLKLKNPLNTSLISHKIILYHS